MRPVLLLAMLLPTASVLAADADLPQRKEGLWEVTNQMEVAGGFSQTIEMCVGRNTDNLMAQGTGDASTDCDPPTVKRDGARIEVLTKCRMDGGTATSKGIFTGNFAEDYQGDITITYDPPQHGMHTTKMKISGRRTGPCATGQKPGDVRIKGMPMNFNIEEMMKNMPKPPAH